MTERQAFTVKTRYVWFTLADWQAFSDALAETYPEARYDIRPTHKTGPDRPDTIWDRHLMDVPLSWNDSVYMTFNPEWTPEYKISRRRDDPPDITRWGDKNGPTHISRMPFVEFMRTTAPTEDELAVITKFRQSDIHYFCRTDDKTAAAHMRRFFRLLDKFCTNRNQAAYWPDSYQLIGVQAKGSWDWFGHDAIRWAREKPMRFMEGTNTCLTRPVTEEEMVQLRAQLPQQTEDGS